MKVARMFFGAVGCTLLLCAACAVSAVPAFAVDKGVTTMITSEPLNMRVNPNAYSDVILVIPEGTSVQVFGMTSDGWYDVSYNNERGNCWYQFLTFEGTANNTVHDGHITDMYATAPLNVRSAPNTSSSILGSLAVDQAVAVTAKNDGWFTVSFNGQEGYCNGQWLRFGEDGEAACAAPAPTTANVMNTLTAAAPLNVRVQPSTSSAIIGSYKQGEQVKVLASVGNDDWYQVLYNNQTGYVSTAWLQ